MEARQAKPQTRIAVVGAGPIGLEAGLYARALNLPVTIYERGRIGEFWHRWGHVRLFSPFRLNATPLGRAAIRRSLPNHELPGDEACLTGKEHIAAYLEPLAKSEELRSTIRTDSQVLKIGRRGLLKNDDLGASGRAKQPFRILLRDSKNREWIEEADAVLDCTGNYGQHRWLGDGGIPALGELNAEAQIAYNLEDIVGERKGHYANKTTLLIGGGYSAATTACNLAELAADAPATWTIWLSRCPGTQPLKRIPNDPLRERDRLAMRANALATRGDGNVEFHSQSFIEAVEFHGPDRGFRVKGRTAAKPQTWEVDRLIANVGYSPDTALYRELQVHECYATLGPMKLAAALAGQRGQDCLTQTSQGPETLRNPEPNFYILGAKSYGRASNFLLRVGFEQVREAFQLITGNTGLDLYGKK
jgi:hypothetical protein